MTAELWTEFYATRDRDLRDRLIVQYLPLVKYVAGRNKMSLEFAEQMSLGNIGLIQSVDRFNPFTGVTFQTYAIPRIRGAMFDGVDAQEHRRRRVADADVTMVSLDQERHDGGDDGGLRLEEYLPDPRVPDFGDVMVYREELDDLVRASTCLSARETGLLDAYYWGDQTLREIGAAMHVSTSRVSQLRGGAVARLRGAMEGSQCP